MLQEVFGIIEISDDRIMIDHIITNDGWRIDKKIYDFILCNILHRHVRVHPRILIYNMNIRTNILTITSLANEDISEKISIEDDDRLTTIYINKLRRMGRYLQTFVYIYYDVDTPDDGEYLSIPIDEDLSLRATDIIQSSIEYVSIDTIES